MSCFCSLIGLSLCSTALSFISHYISSSSCLSFFPLCASILTAVPFCSSSVSNLQLITVLSFSFPFCPDLQPFPAPCPYTMPVSSSLSSSLFICSSLSPIFIYSSSLSFCSVLHPSALPPFPFYSASLSVLSLPLFLASLSFSFVPGFPCKKKERKKFSRTSVFCQFICPAHCHFFFFSFCIPLPYFSFISFSHSFSVLLPTSMFSYSWALLPIPDHPLPPSLPLPC